MDARRRLAQLETLGGLAEVKYQSDAATLNRLRFRDADLTARAAELAANLQSASDPTHGLGYLCAGRDKARARWIEKQLAGLNRERALLRVEIEKQQGVVALSFGKTRALAELAKG